MKVLVVGGGGREHALIKKLKESPRVTALHAAPGNGGISLDAQCHPVSATDLDAQVRLAKELAIDLVLIAPDDPLAMGLTDRLEAAGIRAFGPSQKAAEIESSKVFSKDLMKKYGIPTADYKVFTAPEDALCYISERETYPIVIKADGLALGKGVVIAEDYAGAENAVNAMMKDKIFGESGNTIVVEEYLTGPEVSVLAFSDGKTVSPMVSATDHKRIFDGDKGPNTGGMGTISPSPYYSEELAERCMKEIFMPTVHAMNKENRIFKGCLYFGLMITKDGPKVIEYNCRFGDPEAQSVLPLLHTDLLDILEAVIEGRLGELKIEWKSGSCACVIMASGGYPGAYQKGIEITGLDESGQIPDVAVYHAGTELRSGKLYTSGGRVLGVSARGETLPEALRNAYAGIEKIHFDGAQFRRDIGRKSIEREI